MLGSEWLLNCLQLLDWWINISLSYVSKFKFLRRRKGGKEGCGGGGGGEFRYSQLCQQFLYMFFILLFSVA